MEKNQPNKKKYEQLRDELLDYIKKNNLKHNDQLPTVRELIKNIGFSYATVHRTLIEMEKEGLITKRQGKGLFVNMVEPHGTNKQVALIVPKDFSDHKIFIDILTGIRIVLEKNNIGLLVSISNMSHEKEKETIQRLILNRVGGIILFLEDNYMSDYSHIVELKDRAFPFVLVDRYIPGLETDYVVINNKDTMLKICSYLKYNRRCDNILFVPPPDNSIVVSSSHEKILGYKSAMQMLYGYPEGEVIQFDELLTRLNELSSAYANLGICMNHDSLIVDFQKKYLEQNGKLPENCHFFGYNNSFDAPLFPTVEQFNEKVGAKAAEILVEKLKNPSAPPAQVRIEAKLVLPNKDGGFYLEE